MKRQGSILIILGVLAEVAIFLIAYQQHSAIEDVFRYAARYSGRLSLLLFLFAFYLFATAYPKPIASNSRLRQWISLFAICHLIHFGFLATCVVLNDIPLETIKVIGGALAYIMILLAPFLLHKLNFPLQLVYFYYVSLVMSLTYVARIKGEFQGAETSWVHFVGIGLMLASCFVFGLLLFIASKKPKPV